MVDRRAANLGALVLASLLLVKTSFAQYELLYEFRGDLESIRGGLTVAPDGSLYGTTYDGGQYGEGSVFVLRPQGSGDDFFEDLYHLLSSLSAKPAAAPLLASDGNLYGTTEQGGNGYGTLFRIDSVVGTLQTIHRFDRSAGAYPTASLIEGSDGNLYGTTKQGGGGAAQGTIFRWDLSSDLLTTLHSFQGGADGAAPMASLLEAADGNFYGTTESGGTHGNGTVFQMDSSGIVTILHSFEGGTEGRSPLGALVEGPEGSLDGGETMLPFEGDFAIYAHPGFLLRVTGDGLLAHRFDPDRLEVLGEPFPFGPAVARPSFVSAISVSDNGVLAYRTPARQGRQMTWFDRTGAELEVVPVPGEPLNVRLSPDGTRIAYQHQGDIWIVNAEGGDRSRFTFGSGSFATWSPDGRSLAYSVREEGIFRSELSGALPPGLLLNVFPESTQPNDWSPDGRFLLFRSQSEERIDTDLKVLPLSPIDEPFPIGESVGFHETHGAFSPDGRFVAYASTETGRFEVFVQPFPPTGRKWQVSHRGGFLPRWRKDGSELFYIASDGQLMAVPIQLTADRFESETPAALFQTYVNLSRISESHYDVSPDGTKFLLNAPVRDPAPVEIVVVLNWDADLER